VYAVPSVVKSWNMTRRRWIADEVSGNHATLVGSHAEHLSRVLRARVGQEFDISSGDEVRRGRITRIQPDRVEFELGEIIPVLSSPQVTLALSIFKFDRMEWAIEKCTELGVSRIVPVISRRTDSHLAAASAKRIERWLRIVRQAAEQSRRSTPPEIAAPIKLSDALKSLAGWRIVLAESEEQILLRDVLKRNVLKPEAEAVRITLAVGPEGGWTEDEGQAFQQAGWISASLGNTILRAETAAIAATAIVTSAIFSF
jgi:16S rRNA (uracil1498-N3)-methyltransferase